MQQRPLLVASLIAAVALLPPVALADPLPPGPAVRANFTDPWQPPTDPRVVDRPDASTCSFTERFPSSFWLTDERLDCADGVWLDERLGVSWQPDV